MPTSEGGLISVVSPVYRAEGCIGELCRRIAVAVSSLEGVTDYEIILVDDRSPDASWSAVMTECMGNPRVRGLRLSRNFGQHHAITAGLDHARGDWVVVMDCDLQDRPEDIPLLWQAIRGGAQVACARRMARTDPPMKRFLSRCFHMVFESISGMRYDPRVANFRIISRRVADAFAEMRESTRGFGIQVHWLGFTTVYVDVQHGHRHAGESSYDFARSLRVATDCIVSYSNRPLKIAIWIGIAFVAAAFIGAAAIIIRKIAYGIPVDGWTSLIVTLAAASGTIIAILGIIGLYLGKIYDCVKRRPIYAVEECSPPRPHGATG